MAYRVIRLFDPWKSPLCTCPTKWVLHPYTGCEHGCLYCYASSYIPKHFSPRPKKDLVENVLHDLKAIPRGSLIEMSTSSDPYTPPEHDLALSRKVIKEILEHGMRLLITTKSDLVVRDLDIFSKYGKHISIAITITTIDENVAKVVEPGAPPPQRRLEALNIVRKAGIPAIVRIDPIIPYVNDDYDMLRKLVKNVAEAGALQITSSTYKAKLDNLNRMKRALPKLADVFNELYIEKGIRIHGYMYLDEKIRYTYMKMVKELAEEYGLVFATCREGFKHLHTPGFACDGSSFTQENTNL